MSIPDDSIKQSKRFVGLPIDDIPEEYDRQAVARALREKPPKRSKRIPWSEYPDTDPSEGDEQPERPGCESQARALQAGRCAAPLANSVGRFGEMRYCTRLPERRMGRGNWKEGSDFCTHHCHLERQAVAAREVFDLHTDESLPYKTRL